MTSLAFTRTGTGDSLVLRHGLGSSRQAWAPVIPVLAVPFDVCTVDSPDAGILRSSPDRPNRSPPPKSRLPDALIRRLVGVLVIGIGAR